MKNDILLGIIIPVYNVNAYICECIDSVIELEETEVIVVDDGSKENTDFIIEKYKNYSNFKFFRKTNSGLSSARNFGIEKAKTEYVMFLDGDDFVDIEEMRKVLLTIKNTRKEAYFYSFRNYLEKGCIWLSEREEYYLNKEFISVEDKEFIEKPFSIVAWRYIVKLELIKENNLFFKEGIYHEDEEWTPRLLSSIKKIYSLKSTPYFYRQREGSIMNSQIKYRNIQDSFIIFDLLENYRKNIDSSFEKEFIENRQYTTFVRIITKTLLYNFNKNEYKEFKKMYYSKRKKLRPQLKIKSILIKYLPFIILKYILKKVSDYGI